MARVLMILLALVLAGCTLPKVDPQREAQADHTYEQVRRKDVTGLKATATPALARQDLTGPMEQLQAFVHASEPTAVETVQWASQTTNGHAVYRIVRLYTHPEGRVQFDVLMARDETGRWLVDGLYATPVTAAMAQQEAAATEASRFSLSGRTPAHYAVLGGAVLSFLVCLVTAIVAGVRRRWLWMVGSLFGFGKLMINWTTGALAAQPIYVALLGAGFMKGPGATDPWLISVALPLPAIFFWALGKWRPKPPKRKPEADNPIEPDARWSDS
jgi:hypothetical protein